MRTWCTPCSCDGWGIDEDKFNRGLHDDACMHVLTTADVAS